MLADAVRAFGYRSAIAFNDVQAVRAAREFSPHVVLLDIRMPGIDGHGVLGHSRARSSAPAIIVISGNADVSGMDRISVVRPAGVEPATLGLEVRCSIRLSYGRVR